MTLSEFTLRIILIFLPGLIAYIIIEQLTVHKEIRPYRFFINSLILGFLCYLIYYPISLISNLEFNFIQSLLNNKASPDIKEILITILLSIPLGFIFSKLINRKILHKFAQKLKVTNKFADIDVWSLIMNSEIPEWVVIRDIENDLMYEGWVHFFSDSTERDELFLRDVKVFTNSTAQPLYEVPGLYLPRKRENLTIEFPAMKFSEYKERQMNDKKEAKNG